MSFRDIEKIDNIVISFEKYERNRQSRDFFIIDILYNFLLSILGSFYLINKAMDKCIKSTNYLTNTSQFSSVTKQACIFLALKGKYSDSSNTFHTYEKIKDIYIQYNNSQDIDVSKSIEIKHKDDLVNNPPLELSLIILKKAFEEADILNNTILK